MKKEYSLCWKCKKSTKSGCEWAKNFKPVPGWTAKPTIRGYNVKKCPKFVRGR